MDAPFYKPKPSRWRLYPECEELLIKLHAAKYSFTLIALNIINKTGIVFTRNACIGRARRLGLSVREGKPPAHSKEISHQDRVRAARQGYDRQGHDGALWHKLNRIKAMPQMAERLRFTEEWVGSTPELPFIGKLLIDLEAYECRYPHGNGPFLFCAQPTIDGSSYCEHHAKLTVCGRPAPKPRAWIAARQS